ncbi:NAD-dependent protein deacylase 1 [Massilia varians]|uniref:NAD-dependent protein deacylase n=1 Tax=Massilia varians TaxID=457921 RepID=A0ABM8C9U5_9BURK|nr:NAD-dependent deacylase [Massilia varians]BDT60053.1 NAD-dependent protein deacylase 1 [Massilia varians]
MSATDVDPGLVAALHGAQHVMVLTGAGVSAESGIPTFRDALTGLWQHFDAASLATLDAFRRDPALVWGWYEWRRMKALSAQPNAGHVAIAQLAGRVERLSLFTQNVDDLHERAGSHEVQHLHGSLHHPRCADCSHPFVLPAAAPVEPEGGRRLAPPRCPACGGPVRPGVVWFNEALPEAVLARAFDACGSCDLLIVVGTSGTIYPVAQLPEVARRAGSQVVQVNPAASGLDRVCTWNLRGSAAQVLPALISHAWRPA